MRATIKDNVGCESRKRIAEVYRCAIILRSKNGDFPIVFANVCGTRCIRHEAISRIDLNICGNNLDGGNAAADSSVFSTAPD